MPNIDDSVRSMVAREVEAALAPHQANLQALARFLGPRGLKPSKAPAAAPGNGVAPAAKPRNRSSEEGRSDLAKAIALAAKLKPGQAVQYKQGRGVFDARVQEVNKETGMVRIFREKDGTIKDRPADKLYAAA